MNWNRSNTIKLIEYIRQYDQLQQKSMNLTQPDRVLRKKLIRLIAVNMKCNEAEIIRKLQNLRCHFYREVQKERNDTKYVPKTMRHKPFVSKWYGYELLKFLKNGYVKRNTRPTTSCLRPTNIKTQFKSGDAEEVEWKEEYQPAVSDILLKEQPNATQEMVPYINQVRSCALDNIKSDPSLGEEPSDTNDIISLDDSSSSSECGEKEPPMKNETYMSKDEYVPLNNEMITTERVNQDRKPAQDQFTIFGDFIASELRSTPGECNQLILKKRIQDLIFQLKIDILRGKEIKYQPKSGISMDSD